MITLANLEAAIAAFLAGGDFWPLWRVTMGLTEVIDTQPISHEARKWSEDVYDLVYMGSDVEPDEQARARGVLKATELRNALGQKFLVRPSLTVDRTLVRDPDAS